ncbi:MAG TPA: ProQ/FINO family protein [Burkholderiaceae bacterium]|nr:ProQ/FINO family protein [Burkholderiaceae bacterium]
MQSTPPVEPPSGEPVAPSEATPAEVAEVAVAQVPDAAAPVEPSTDAPAAPSPAKDLSPAATGARLAELFPALFVGPDGRGEWKAIKLRIHADIQARAPGEFSKRALGIFFSRYTTTTAYLKALAAPGAQRVDLDGQPAGEIAEEHRKAAEEEVARRQAIVAERRAAYKREARPPRDAAPVDAPPARPPRAPEPREGERGPDRRPPRHESRPPRREGPDARAAGPRPARPPRPSDPRYPSSRPERAPRQAPAPEDAPSTALPVDPAQRDRALLLRAFESSPLSKANFCVLKRISEADLDAALALARDERQARRPG